MKEAKKVGIWVRVSSSMQVDKESHIHHEMNAKRFVESRSWEIVKTYRLEAMSGKSVLGYAQTQEMLEDVKNGVISGLVFSKIARLARNTKELITISELFQEHNADLISMDMTIDTSTSIGRHFFRQMSSMAEWEREMISERISASVASRAELGKQLGGQASFGFCFKDKKLCPDENEAPILKLMFELFLEHKRKKTVANILNQMGHRTRKGKQFTDSTVKRLLMNPVAKGLYIQNRRRSSSAAPNTFKPKEEWVSHQVKAIVTEELFNQVNDIITQQKKTHKQVLNTKVHLFTGYVFCHCGSRMYTRYNHENYLCHGHCGNKIHKDDLEIIFRDELKDYTVNKKQIDQYFGRVKLELKNEEKELTSLRKKQEKLHTHIEKILLLHTEGKISTKAFDSYHTKPYEQLTQVDKRITELERNITQGDDAKKITHDVITLAQSLYERWDNLSHEEKRNVIETIVKRIEVGKDEIDIQLFKILPDSQNPHTNNTLTNGQHDLYSMMRVSKRSFGNQCGFPAKFPSHRVNLGCF